MIIEQPAVDVETIQSVSSANNVSLKITFEFSTTTTTEELIGNIKYNMNVTTLGNISVATAPQLAIFKSTGTRNPSCVTIPILLYLQPICQSFARGQFIKFQTFTVLCVHTVQLDLNFMNTRVCNCARTT